jgi:hypothetical protein
MSNSATASPDGIRAGKPKQARNPDARGTLADDARRQLTLVIVSPIVVHVPNV